MPNTSYRRGNSGKTRKASKNDPPVTIRSSRSRVESARTSMDSDGLHPPTYPEDAPQLEPRRTSAHYSTNDATVFLIVFFLCFPLLHFFLLGVQKVLAQRGLHSVRLIVTFLPPFAQHGKWHSQIPYVGSGCPATSGHRVCLPLRSFVPCGFSHRFDRASCSNSQSTRSDSIMGATGSGKSTVRFLPKQWPFFMGSLQCASS